VAVLPDRPDAEAGAAGEGAKGGAGRQAEEHLRRPPVAAVELAGVLDAAPRVDGLVGLEDGAGERALVALEQERALRTRLDVDAPRDGDVGEVARLAIGHLLRPAALLEVGRVAHRRPRAQHHPEREGLAAARQDDGDRGLEEALAAQERGHAAACLERRAPRREAALDVAKLAEAAVELEALLMHSM